MDALKKQEQKEPTELRPQAVSKPPRGDSMRDKGGQRKRNTRRGSREPRARSEFDQKIINVRRVARVSSGGKRFSFSVAMIIGNRKGSVGVGTGKGADTAIAIDKATRSAKKHLLRVMTTPSSSIPHLVQAKYSSARIILMPAPGRGIIAGSAVRSVLELAGIKDVTAKILSPSKNVLNMARAAVEALAHFSSFAAHTRPAVSDTKGFLDKTLAVVASTENNT